MLFFSLVFSPDLAIPSKLETINLMITNKFNIGQSVIATLSNGDEIAENEVIFDYSGKGRGWTVVRAGEDEKGAFEEWIGEFFPSYEEAEAAAKGWK